MKKKAHNNVKKMCHVDKPEHAQKSVLPVEVFDDWLGNTFSKSTSDVNILLDAGEEQYLKFQKKVFYTCPPYLRNFRTTEQNILIT